VQFSASGIRLIFALELAGDFEIGSARDPSTAAVRKHIENYGPIMVQFLNVLSTLQEPSVSRSFN